MSDGHTNGVALRLLALLAGGPARIEPARPGTVLLSNCKGAMAIASAVLQRLANGGKIERHGDRVSLTGMGAVGSDHDFQGQHRDLAPIVFEGGASVAVNLAESPLGQLARRKDKEGRPFLSRAEVDAGERLRVDFTRGMMMPRLGANWEASVAMRRRGSAGGVADLTDAALAARRRVDLALTAVGPELSGLLVDVCCFLKGLETVERERAWPMRSAKIVLKTALGVLARHYQPSQSAAQARTVHWGADGYRPESV
jgi:hypothetical protein